MLTRLSQATVPAVLLLCASCSSTPETSSQAAIDPAVSGVATETAEGANTRGATAAAVGSKAANSAEEVPDFFAPKAWTGAFTETAVMVADTVRIEGPQGLLDHVAAASDDEFYERTAEVTSEGFRQTIRRLGPDAPEIRVRIDRWTVAATQRVVILENINACEVTVVAGGEAIWRDVNGQIARADRLEFVGEIGQNAPVRPAQMMDANAIQSATESGTAATEQETAPTEISPDESSNDQSRPNEGSPNEGNSGEATSESADGPVEEPEQVDTKDH